MRSNQYWLMVRVPVGYGVDLNSLSFIVQYASMLRYTLKAASKAPQSQTIKNDELKLSVNRFVNNSTSYDYTQIVTQTCEFLLLSEVHHAPNVKIRPTVLIEIEIANAVKNRR